MLALMHRRSEDALVHAGCVNLVAGVVFFDAASRLRESRGL